MKDKTTIKHKFDKRLSHNAFNCEHPDCIDYVKKYEETHPTPQKEVDTQTDKPTTCFDRTEVLGAMYELRSQGFRNVTATILMDGTLALFCNSTTLGIEDQPQIEIDSIDCWYEKDLEDPLLDPAKTAGITKYDFWWIFD